MGEVKIRDLNPWTTKRRYGYTTRYDEFINLLLNNIAIVHKDGSKYEYQVETFIKRGLIERGKLAFDSITNIWSQVAECGRLNEYGNMDSMWIIYQNGKSLLRKRSFVKETDGCYIISALPNYFCLSKLIQETADFISNCENAIIQNIDAIKTPYIVTCKDDKLRLSIEHAIEQKQNGKPVLVVSEALGDGLTSTDISVEYIADKIDEIKQKRIDILLNKLGIMSANINKKERVQVGEVNATVGQCLDYIYMLIDTFNKQMELYGIDAKMLDNTSLGQYLKEVEKNEGGNDNGKENKDKMGND